MNDAAAVAAIVLSAAVPIEPPTCCTVFAIADATPESWATTPYVPTSKQVAKISPSARPKTNNPGRTCDTYAVLTPIYVSNTMPTPLSSMPATTGIRVPILGSSTAVEVVAITIRVAIIGRKAKPVLIGE